MPQESLFVVKSLRRKHGRQMDGDLSLNETNWSACYWKAVRASRCALAGKSRCQTTAPMLGLFLWVPQCRRNKPHQGRSESEMDRGSAHLQVKQHTCKWSSTMRLRTNTTGTIEPSVQSTSFTWIPQLGRQSGAGGCSGP